MKRKRKGKQSEVLRVHLRKQKIDEKQSWSKSEWRRLFILTITIIQVKTTPETERGNDITMSSNEQLHDSQDDSTNVGTHYDQHTVQ